ncbi:PQQ-binding-like beta-propeller repeat protein [Streptomyces sp. XD-27]|uniref:outer membrane protein assembly factor BamB family protein n=1 Tax=Streptomyces sp. XD-27 TaxID=3062779 RepID=UPI0026F41C95|nr:PQQ-binding-like beta-propeller repeat protein [Streptomyces sp. XD-27]WKX72920.1 PQQ-binding-like beta-propeller repeat protein [Streptomyces sp. XD-27]
MNDHDGEGEAVGSPCPDHGESAARRYGPYLVVDELDSAGQAYDACRVAARHTVDGRLVTLMLPHPELAHDPGYRVLFRAEAENSRRLTGPWVAPVADISDAGAATPWVAYDCFPVLPLPAAVAAHGGPLPEAVVRALGAALAATLVDAHANGLVHAGISPAALLLTEDGPRLTGYGLGRTSAPGGAARPGRPGGDPHNRPPEQHPGARPEPPGDVYALGAVLAYAATGRTDPDPARLPHSLRELIASCLSRDPDRRPRPEALLRALGGQGAGPPLPDAVTAALTAQHPVAARPPEPAAEAGVGAAPSSAARPRPSRRTVLVGAGSGLAGLALGAGAIAGWRALEDEPRRLRPTAGIPPSPLWHRTFPWQLENMAGLSDDRIALLKISEGLIGVDVGTGRKVWTRADLQLIEDLRVLDGGLVLISGGARFSMLSARNGKVIWTEEKYGSLSALSMKHVLAAEGQTLWFLAERRDCEEADTPCGKTPYAAVGYDLGNRRELWRTPLPKSFGSDRAMEGLLTRGELLVPNTGDDYSLSDTPFTYLALDRRTGRELRRTRYQGLDVDLDSLRMAVPGDLLLASSLKNLRAYDIASGEERWRYDGLGQITAAAVHETMVFATDFRTVTHALDVRDGKRRWRRASAVPLESSITTSETWVSHSGATVIQMNASEIEALNAADGSLRWRLAVVGREGGTAGPGWVGGTAPGMVFVIGSNDLYAFPVD